MPKPRLELLMTLIWSQRSCERYGSRLPTAPSASAASKAAKSTTASKSRPRSTSAKALDPVCKRVRAQSAVQCRDPLSRREQAPYQLIAYESGREPCLLSSYDGEGMMECGTDRSTFASSSPSSCATSAVTSRHTSRTGSWLSPRSP